MAVELVRRVAVQFRLPPRTRAARAPRDGYTHFPNDSARSLIAAVFVRAVLDWRACQRHPDEWYPGKASDLLFEGRERSQYPIEEFLSCGCPTMRAELLGFFQSEAFEGLSEIIGIDAEWARNRIEQMEAGDIAQ